ncbi:MAG: hypothetical protein LBR10_14645, partial [Prevotellaceae bacterium]|nr:hypothetical protein [Prevotellaceae bacterium]
PAFQAENIRVLFRRSMTCGYENQALRAVATPNGGAPTPTLRSLKTLKSLKTLVPPLKTQTRLVASGFASWKRGESP